MPNNRLYIIDTETGDKFMLCQSMGIDKSWGIYDSETLDKLDRWLKDRDCETIHNSGKISRLVFRTEHELEEFGWRPDKK